MKRTGRSLLALALSFVAFLAVGRAAAASEIRVCEHAGLRPPCIDLRHGVDDLREWGLSNRISSFVVRSGEWLLWTETGFRGRCAVVSASHGNLQGTPFQDAISSLRPVREGGGGSWGGWGGAERWQRLGLAAYSGRNFTGKSWVFTDDVRDLRDLGLNDRISSIRVLGGRWRICRRPGFVSCTELTGDVADLGRFGFDDQVSSIQELGPAGWSGGGTGPAAGWDGPRGSATLYERPRYRGRPLPVHGAVPNLSRLGFNDRAASIRLEGRWLLCSDANYRGRCQVVSGDVANLSKLGLRYALSSMRPER